MKKIFLSAMVLAAAVGCNKTQISGEHAEIGVEIQLGSSMETSARSRAAYSGDVAISGLQFIRKDGSVLPTDFSGTLPFSGSRAVGGLITFAGTQKYAPSGNTYIASYFPEGTVAANTVTWVLDGKTDVMTAAAVDAGTNAAPLPSANLSYQHQLAQIEVVLKASVDAGTVQTRWGNVTGIFVANTPTTMSYNYATLSTTAGAVLGNVPFVSPDYATDFVPIAIPAMANGTVNAATMVVPRASRTFELQLTFANETPKTITVDLLGSNTLARGQKHKVTLTFYPAATEKDIVITSTIEGWNPGAAGTGEVL